ncbi:hypothetical protein [Haladaptatus caseinilyticus]|nr:hypothetical protein [Haladaptatus caseinilyticus]
MEQERKRPEWRELAKHVLTGVALLTFVWLIRRLQGEPTDG